MKLLFFDGASGCIRDNNNNIYTSSNLEGNIIKRYKRYCNELILLLIDKNDITHNADTLKASALDNSLAKVITVPNIRRPRINFFNLALRKKVIDTIERAIRDVDRVIIRAPGRFYTNTALRMCRKYNKPYLIEAVDFVYEYLSYKWYTRFFAPYCEFMAKSEISRAPYVVYCSQNALQQRYPASGKSLGCSDVEIPEEIYRSAKLHSGGGGY